MTPDNRQPRKRRRRRRRPADAMAGQPSQGNGPMTEDQPGSTPDQQTGEGQPSFNRDRDQNPNGGGGGGGGRRRRRSRHRRRGGSGGGGQQMQEGPGLPAEIPS